jgi:hypothetical protein
MNECYIAQRLMNFPEADRVCSRGVKKEGLLGQERKGGREPGNT